MLTLLSIACFLAGATDTGADAPATWTGTERTVRTYTGPDDTADCDLRWTTSGARADSAACPECSFVFAVERVYDAASSDHDGSCLALEVDGTAVYGYREDRDLDGNEPGADVVVGTLGSIESGTWVELGAADWDESTGTFTYSFGAPDDGYSTGTYTDSTTGTAALH
jgi:hypothetical protein